MEDLCDVSMSVGTMSQSEKTTTAVVAEPVEEARDSVQEQRGAHLDETRWRQGGKRAWLWVAVTSWVTVFVVRMSRGGQVARALLGEGFTGMLVTDRSSAYNGYPVRWRQRCWAHVLRDFAAIRERGGAGEEIGDALLAQAHQMFAWWHRVREGTLKRSTFRTLFIFHWHYAAIFWMDSSWKGMCRSRKLCSYKGCFNIRAYRSSSRAFAIV